MRFDLPAYPTVYFSENIWVHCPKCAEPALVKTELPKYTLPFPVGHRSVCSCRHCGYEEADKETWAGYLQGFINRACGNCGSGITHTTAPTRNPYSSAEMTCTVCKNKRDYEIQWYRYRNEKATDPFFGFDLYLQTSVKQQVLWLYNLEHLTYLRQYVEAGLREDDGRHKYSMITNLPQWVKAHKNRELIVKRLNRLQQDFERKIKSDTL